MPTALADTPPRLVLAAAIVAALAVARLTRLGVYDTYPPVAWARERYANAVHHGPWEGLVTCTFCFAPWPALATLLWAWFGGLNPETLSGGLWWLLHSWLALAYVAAMIAVRDGPYIDTDDE